MLPEVAGKVIQLAESPDSCAPQLAKLIQSDQALAGNVMRVANSAVYSRNSTLTSLQQAITRLGMKQVTEIAISASVNTRLFRAPGFETHIANTLKRSLASGLWSKEVARACRKNVESAFLVGLLHDVGRPAAIQCILEIQAQSGASLSREQVFELEERFQHQIGLRVVESWEMPAAVHRSISYLPNYMEQHTARTLTLTVVAGALIAHRFMDQLEGRAEEVTEDQFLDHEVFAELNLYRDELQALFENGTSIGSAMEAMSQ